MVRSHLMYNCGMYKYGIHLAVEVLLHLLEGQVGG